MNNPNQIFLRLREITKKLPKEKRPFSQKCSDFLLTICQLSKLSIVFFQGFYMPLPQSQIDSLRNIVFQPESFVVQKESSLINHYDNYEIQKSSSTNPCYEISVIQPNCQAAKPQSSKKFKKYISRGVVLGGISYILYKRFFSYQNSELNLPTSFYQQGQEAMEQLMVIQQGLLPMPPSPFEHIFNLFLTFEQNEQIFQMKSNYFCEDLSFTIDLMTNYNLLYLLDWQDFWENQNCEAIYNDWRQGEFFKDIYHKPKKLPSFMILETLPLLNPIKN